MGLTAHDVPKPKPNEIQFKRWEAKEEEGQDPQALGQQLGMDKVGVSAQQDLSPSPAVPSGGQSPDGGLNGSMPIQMDMVSVA